jgi:hypothetical protein
LFALTLFHASQTARFKISNGLPGDFSSPTRLLPGQRLVDRTNGHGRPGTFAPPSLQRAHRYYEPVRRRAPRRYSIPHGVNRFGTLPLAYPR